jgi:hypothetical protein
VLVLAAEGFYFIYEFVLKGYQLEYFFYASYLFAFSAIGVTVLIAELATRHDVGPSVAWLACLVVIALPVARNVFFHGLEFWAWPAVPVMVVATGSLFLVSTRTAKLANVGAGVMVASIVLLGISPPRNVPMSPAQTVRADPHYELAIGNTSRLGLDWFKISSDLIRTVPKWDRDPGTVLFWYRDDASILDLVQATYGWVGASLQYGAPGLPTLNPSQIAELKGRTPRTIVILAHNAGDIEAGHRAIMSLGLQPLSVVDQRLVAGRSTVYTERLTFHAAPCDQHWRTIYSAWRSQPPTC